MHLDIYFLNIPLREKVMNLKYSYSLHLYKYFQQLYLCNISYMALQVRNHTHIPKSIIFLQSGQKIIKLAPNGLYEILQPHFLHSIFRSIFIPFYILIFCYKMLYK